MRDDRDARAFTTRQCQPAQERRTEELAGANDGKRAPAMVSGDAP